MEWTQADEDFGPLKAQIYAAEHPLAKENQFDHLMDRKTLSAISDRLSRQTFDLINHYRETLGKKACTWDVSLQLGANIRGKEILTTPDTKRPNGTEGFDAPYEFGYPKEKKETTFESIGSFSSNSLKWILENTPTQVLAMFKNGDENFLKEDNSEEQAVGVYIEETPEAYFVGIDLLCGKVKEVKKVVAKPKPVNKSKLVKLYNYSTDLVEAQYLPTLWGELMLVKAEAKVIYSNKKATQQEVDAITERLQIAIDQLCFKP